MTNAYADPIKDIFECRDKLERLDKGTLEFGFEWKPEDGITLFPKSTISQYYSGFFSVVYPETKVIELEATPMGGGR